MNVFQAAVLGLVQGLAEFLPISSSGHLILARMLMGISDAEAATGSYMILDVLLHTGTLLAVMVVFWKDWWGILKNPFTSRLLLLLIVASIPALAEKTAALEAMGQELATAQANASTAETLETELDQLQQDKDALAAELTDCKTQLGQAQAEKARLTAELEQAQTGQARYEALRKETEAARLIWDMMEQDMDNLAVRKSVEAAIANFQQKYPDSLMVFRLPDQ